MTLFVEQYSENVSPKAMSEIKGCRTTVWMGGTSEAVGIGCHKKKGHSDSTN